MIKNKNHIRKVDTGKVPMKYKPVFTKIMKKEVDRSVYIDFNSGLYLRKLTHLFRTMDNLTTDTLIYSPNKEHLVDTVNQRNSIILHNLMENIETVKLLCIMDRSYRSKIYREIEVQNTLNKTKYSRSQIKSELRQHSYSVIAPESNLSIEGDSSGLNFNIELESRNGASTISDEELRNLISDTPLKLDNSCNESRAHSSELDNSATKLNEQSVANEGLTQMNSRNPELNAVVNKLITSKRITVTNNRIPSIDEIDISSILNYSPETDVWLNSVANYEEMEPIYEKAYISPFD